MEVLWTRFRVIYLSIQWKKLEKNSWDKTLIKPENFLKELQKPYSYGILWLHIYEKNFRTILNLVGGVKGLRVLDVGCGGGWLCEWLSREGAIPLGVDISFLFCKISKERAKTKGFDADFVCADGEHLPFRNNSFELTIFYQSLHHCPNPKLALNEALRVSKAVVLGDEPAKTPLLRILKLSKIILSLRVNVDEMSGIKEHRFDPSKIEHFYRGKGYHVKFVREWSFVPSLLSKTEKLKFTRILYKLFYKALTTAFLKKFANGFTLLIRKSNS